MSSRQQPETRKVRVGGYDPSDSKDNVVSMSKFSWWNFLPLALMAEFRGWLICTSSVSLFSCCLPRKRSWCHTSCPSVWTVGVLAFPHLHISVEMRVSPDPAPSGRFTR